MKKRHRREMTRPKSVKAQRRFEQGEGGLGGRYGPPLKKKEPKNIKTEMLVGGMEKTADKRFGSLRPETQWGSGVKFMAQKQ